MGRAQRVARGEKREIITPEIVRQHLPEHLVSMGWRVDEMSRLSKTCQAYLAIRNCYLRSERIAKCYILWLKAQPIGQVREVVLGVARELKYEGPRDVVEIIAWLERQV